MYIDPIYLILMYHQHQPFYVDYDKDCLIAPWVRTHATKDYYKMAALLKKYPNVHITINLSPSLLIQLDEFYIKRIKPYIDLNNCKFNINKYFDGKKYRTDPLYDLLIKPTSSFNNEDHYYLYRASWSALSVNEVVRRRFPEYDRIYLEFDSLRKKNLKCNNSQKLRELKFWFALVNFDLDFLVGPVRLVDNQIVDLSDLIEMKRDHKYYLKKNIQEKDCLRLAVEIYKVLSNISLIHKNMQFDLQHNTGQIELTTNPYSHPILPLICNTDDGKISMPNSPFPKRFSYPDDANEQVRKGIEHHKIVFGKPPKGIWPAEGSVSEQAVDIFRKNQIQWIVTDIQILRKANKEPNSYYLPYAFKKNAMFFRDTEISDRISFKYQHMDGEEAANDFIKYLLSVSAKEKIEGKVLTVVLDGENAWEWYHRDAEAREFLNTLYNKLEKMYQSRHVITVTPTEYLSGNRERGIPAHPISTLPVIYNFPPGSWIHGDFGKWIGSEDKNKAWEDLLKARRDFENANVTRPILLQNPKANSKNYYLIKAWEELLIAEGSDWFWWRGEDQESYFNQKPFDQLFYQHLKQAYTFANNAGLKLQIPKFSTHEEKKFDVKKYFSKIGTMSAGRKKVKVIFICDAGKIPVPDAIYITGNCEELGEWMPNLIKMFRDDSQSAQKLKDNIWKYEIELFEGIEIQYKYTNSGKPGEWGKSEEFPSVNRTIFVKANEENIFLQIDYFGHYKRNI